MTYAHIAEQPQHMFPIKNVLHKAVFLALTQRSIVIGHDASGILPPMLQND